MGDVPRSVWIDDSGGGTDGTVLNNAELAKIYDNVNLEVKSAAFPTITTKAIIDAVMLGGTFMFGGDAGRYRNNTAMPAGSTYDILAPGTGILRVDPAWLTGIWRWEAVLRVEPGGSATVSAALVNLTDAPNTALTNSTITSTSNTGALVRSGIVAFGASGANKDFGIKVWTSNAAVGANVAWARLLKTAT
jgi:hypothetical protein